MLKILAILEVIYLLVLGGWIILERRQPLATVSWLLALAALPGVGLVVYYLLGPRRLHRTRARKQRMYQTLSDSLDGLPHSLLVSKLSPELSPELHLPRSVGDSEEFEDSGGDEASERLRDSKKPQYSDDLAGSGVNESPGNPQDSESLKDSDSLKGSESFENEGARGRERLRAGLESEKALESEQELSQSSKSASESEHELGPLSRTLSALSDSEGSLVLSRNGKEDKKTRWEQLWEVPGPEDLAGMGGKKGGLAPELGAYRELIALAKSNSAAPLSIGNTLQLLRSGAEKFPALEKAIRGARRYIHLQYYIYEPDDCGRWLLDLLAQRAREGVKVRLLVDAVGSHRLHRRFLAPLLKAGGEVAFFNRVRFARLRVALNFRNHRKIVVVDGEQGFTGGLNIGNEYRAFEGSPAFRDTHLHLTGPAVAALARVFVEDWYWATGRSSIEFHEPTENRLASELSGVPEAPGPAPSISTSSVNSQLNAASVGELDAGTRDAGTLDAGTRGVSSARGGTAENRELVQIIHSGPDMEWKSVHQFYFSAITQARRRVWLTAAYFVPDEALLCALITASLRGVEVKLLLPSHSDSKVVWWAGRSFYQELLAAGVRIFEYQPAILHAKTAVIDSGLGLVGTANLDPRSFALNWEVVVASYGAGFARELEAMFERDLEESLEIHPGYQRELSFPSRLAEASARVLSPLL